MGCLIVIHQYSSEQSQQNDKEKREQRKAFAKYLNFKFLFIVLLCLVLWNIGIRFELVMIVYVIITLLEYLIYKLILL